MKNSSKGKIPRGLKPIQKIELSEKNKKARIILLIVFSAIAIGAFGFAIFSSLQFESGWYSIAVESGEDHCGNDFIFNHYIGDTDLSAKAQYNEITSLYSDAAVKAYRLFHAEESFSDVNNVYFINTHVGEEIVVDNLLYRAFEQIEESNSRYLYLGPLYAEYQNLFFGYHQAAITEEYDPYTNTEMATYFAEIAAFARDPNAVNLELLGDNRVRLFVSEEYLAFAEENDIVSFIDFFRIKNAFIIDYFAEVMLENGHTHGSISSHDGYTRNLDQSQAYHYNLFDRSGQALSPIATLTYSGGGSLVYLRNYATGEQDAYYFYLSDRVSIPPYIDLQDGLYRIAASGLISYSQNVGCAEIVLKLMPLYIAESIDDEAMKALGEEDIASVWCEDRCVYYTQADFAPTLLITEGEHAYRKQLVESTP